MFKHLKTLLPLALCALTSQSALAERFPDVPRPIDHFINGEEILAFNAPRNESDVPRPIDHFVNGEEILAVNTLRDEFREEGNFKLGKGLLIIGRTDLLGLNPSLDSFDTSTLETPLGGNFEVDHEQAVEFRSARAQRASQRLSGNGTMETPLGGDFATGGMEQAIQFSSARAIRASKGLNRVGYRSGF